MKNLMEYITPVLRKPLLYTAIVAGVASGCTNDKLKLENCELIEQHTKDSTTIVGYVERIHNDSIIYTDKAKEDSTTIYTLYEEHKKDSVKHKKQIGRLYSTIRKERKKNTELTDSIINLKTDYDLITGINKKISEENREIAIRLANQRRKQNQTGKLTWEAKTKKAKNIIKFAPRYKGYDDKFVYFKDNNTSKGMRAYAIFKDGEVELNSPSPPKGKNAVFNLPSAVKGTGSFQVYGVDQDGNTGPKSEKFFYSGGRISNDKGYVMPKF